MCVCVFKKGWGGDNHYIGKITGNNWNLEVASQYVEVRNIETNMMFVDVHLLCETTESADWPYCYYSRLPEQLA